MAGKGNKAADEAGTSAEAAAQPAHPPLTAEGLLQAAMRLAAGQASQKAVPDGLRAQAQAGAAAQADIVDSFNHHFNAIQATLNGDLEADEKLAAVQAELEKGEPRLTTNRWGAAVSRRLLVALN